MFGQLAQVVMLIGTTHGIRVLGRWVGPSRGGLLTGVPSTTAIVLVGIGLRGGLGEAMATSESCLAGLVAASVLPLAYARAASGGWRSTSSAVAAVAAYGAVAAALWWLPATGAAGCAGVAAAGLAVSCLLAGRLGAGAEGRSAAAVRPVSPSVACRTAVPVAYFAALQAVRSLAGAGFSGRFITFPGASLAVLVTTQLEAGPATACKTAAAMPLGGLGMLAFLTAFRFGCPLLGLAFGTAFAFAAALSVLAAAGCAPGRASRRVALPSGLAPLRRWHRGVSTRGVRPPRVRPRFAPALEALAG